MEWAPTTNMLRLKVEGRIEALHEKLENLPPDYYPEVYRKWWEIQDALTGLYEIKRLFLDPPPPDEPSACTEELLY